MSSDEVYLRAILATVARQTFSVADILSHVAPRGNSEKQVLAYNLCDGTRTLTKIASEAKLDRGNLSKSIKRWIDAGIVIKVESGQEVRPVHVYPLPEAGIKKSK
ncbi:MAG: MarR family transcriptional regulator [Pseudomonadota bacterium]